MVPISDSRSLLLFLVLAVSVYGCRSADERRDPEQQSTASHHPTVVSPARPSPAARLMDGMGKVDFPITTKSKDAQAFFNQGVAQLYGFWFIEAERSFLEAAKLDADAAMTYWGIAMAAPGTFLPMYQLALTPNSPAAASPNSPEARARSAILKAEALRDVMTAREHLYIEAVAARHNPASRDPNADYIAVMRRLVESFPDDLNAKSILALALENGFDGRTKTPKAGTDESLKLLREVLRKEPDHIGANHFLIHGLEGGKDIRDAVPVANRYAALAPNIPHVLHMPGHVYAQTGLFDEAVKAFLMAAAKEREYMSADPRYSKLSYVHNAILLIHVLGSQGRYRDAMAHIRDLMSAKNNSADETAEFFYRVGWFALMKTLVRFEKWSEILDGKTLPFYNQLPESLWYHWARGLAYESMSNAAAARSSLQMMEEQMRSLERVVNPIPHQFQIAHDELAGYIDASTGNVKKGLDELNRSATAESMLPYTDPTVYPRPVLELLGKTALKIHNFQIAESAYRRALENEPSSGRALWGLSKALEGLGKKQAAEETLKEFRRVWRGENP